MSYLEVNKQADLSVEEYATYKRIKKTINVTIEKILECTNLSSILAPKHIRAIQAQYNNKALQSKAISNFYIDLLARDSTNLTTNKELTKR